MNESTIVAEYTPAQRVMEDTVYQSEAELERKFISQLEILGYEYVNFHDEKGLIDNLRSQLEKLNNYKFSNNEWKNFFENNIANSNEGIIEKTRKIQIDLFQNQPVTLVDVIDDLVFEMELVEQLEVTIDYILNLVEIYHNSNCEDKEVLTSITKAIGSSPHLRKKKDLIEAFVSTVNSKTNVNEDWKKYVQEKKEEELNRIISEEKLKPEETRKFLDNSFRDGILKEGGTDIDKIMPKVSLFAKGANNRATKKKGILQRLKEFFEKFLGLV